jgi:hypothetical protein
MDFPDFKVIRWMGLGRYQQIRRTMLIAEDILDIRVTGVCIVY